MKIIFVSVYTIYLKSGDPNSDRQKMGILVWTTVFLGQVNYQNAEFLSKLVRLGQEC